MKSIDDDIRRQHGDFEEEDDAFGVYVDPDSVKAYWDAVVKEAAQQVEDAILTDGMIHELMRECNMMKMKAPEIFLWNINGHLFRARCMKCSRIALTDMFDRQFTIDCKLGVTQFHIKVAKPCQCGHMIFRIQEFKRKRKCDAD